MRMFLKAGTVVALGMMISHCGGSSGGKKGGLAKIDVGDFKNTESKSGFFNKADQVDDYYDKINPDGNKPKASGAGNNIFGGRTLLMAENESGEYKEPPSAREQPTFYGEPTDCQEGIGNIEQFYSMSESLFASMIQALKDEGSVGLAGQQPSGLALVEAETDEESAVAYEYSSEMAESLEVSGRISGGANERFLVIHQDISMTIKDPSLGASQDAIPEQSTQQGPVKVSANQRFSADLTERLVEVVSKSSLASGGEVFSTEGAILVSAGDEKYLEQRLNFKLVASGTTKTASVRARADYVGEDQINVRIHTKEDAETRNISYSVVNDGDTCKIVK